MKQIKTNNYHQPALLNEAIKFLKIKPGELYIDATVGGGGHTEQILKKGGKVLGLDCDPEAIDFSIKRLNKVCPGASCKIIKANFVNLKTVLKEQKVTAPAGILFDLGTSLHQLKTERRGFSFAIDEPLDMRMDPELKVRALDLINGLGKQELNALFTKLGEEQLALPIAKAIVSSRREQPIKNTKQLANLVVAVYKRRRFRSKIHPATKVFQALRTAVNDELNNLKKVLPEALEVLESQGRLVVISFHGLEDRIVKRFLKEQEEKKKMLVITKKPIKPSFEEINNNRRVRSAKLRCGEKI